MNEFARVCQMGVAALVSGLLVAVQHLAVQHYGQDRLHRVWRYVLGVLAIIVPLSALMLVWGDLWTLVAVWICTAAAGFVVMSLYGFGDWRIKRFQVMEANEREGLDVRAIIE